MKNRMTTGILFFLFLLNASGVFAAMVENSRQGLPAISVTSHPAFSLESSEQRQGLSRVLLELVSGGAFTSKDPIGFNGGNNLYRYADNNPVLFTDPYGLRPPTLPSGIKWSDTLNLIEKNIQTANNLADPFLFRDYVREGGVWDYKNQKPSLGADFGNYHFGIVAAATHMFYLETALREAGIAQCGSKVGSKKAWGLPSEGSPYGDDPNDQYWIKQGWNDYLNGQFGKPDYVGSRGYYPDTAEILSQQRAASTPCPKVDDNDECPNQK